MTKFWKQNKISIIAATACASVFMGSCNTADEYFGNGFVPDDQLMKTKIDTAEIITAYIAKLDSLYTESDASGYLGSYVDPIFGGRDCGVVTQYSPFEFKNKDSLYGVTPVADSAVLNIFISNSIGDSSTLHTVEVYRMIRPLEYYKKYYSNLDISSFIEPTPMASFQQKGLKTMRAHLPKEFAQSLLDTTGGVYSNDTIFHEKFNGLYLKVRKQLSNGNVYLVNYASSNFNLYYHNDNPVKKDTTFQTFFFQNTYAEINYNKSFTITDFDYSMVTSPQGINPAMIGNTTTPAEFVYTQGLGGVYPVIKLDKAYFDDLKAKAVAAGYKHIAVLQASLIFPLAEPTNDNMGIAPPRLGAYQDINTYKFLPDYNPMDEDQSGITTDFGGYLDRSNKWYKMNLTSYVQGLITEKYDYWSFGLYLNANQMQSLYQVSLNGDAGPKPKLALTYTMIK